MKKFLVLAIAAVLLGMSAQAQGDVTKLLINKSTIYKVEKAALWTTSLNMLTVITKFNVTSTTTIYLNDRPATLSMLRPGYKVTIYYYKDPACTSILDCNIAVKILAYSGVITPL